MSMSQLGILRKFSKERPSIYICNSLYNNSKLLKKVKVRDVCLWLWNLDLVFKFQAYGPNTDKVAAASPNRDKVRGPNESLLVETKYTKYS